LLLRASSSIYHWKQRLEVRADEFQPVKEAVVSDITYVKKDEGTRYLSLVTDAYSRKILGYELSNEMKASDVVKALDMVIVNRQTDAATIHHSDRGLQYCLSEHQEKLNANGMITSMTDGYDCYQNAQAKCMKKPARITNGLHKKRQPILGLDIKMR